jgi:methionyl-tRNA synthetase
MDKKTFYITTPIFYPNAKPHIGHAYTTLVCDTLARYHRLMGIETYFLTGTDENTEKVIQSAQKNGEEPHAYLEKIVATFKDLYARLNIEYDQFIRTSDQEIHWPGAIEMWKRLEQNGDLYKGVYEGFYCVGCESFLTEKDLVDGLCPDHNTKPEILKEENYFFRLSAYTEKIRDCIDSGEIDIVPATRKKELLALLGQGLEDISFSRPAKEIAWGIPVPGDESQRMYVWMDALTNYISALGFGRGEEDMHLWPGIHVVGKDILRFHAAIWPAMLISAGLALPKQILVHGMITSEGKKMSKSLGNVIDPNELITKYGTDATRYFLLRHVHPFEDTDITWERLDEWYEAHLVNGLGNVVARVMRLAEVHLEKPVNCPEAVGFPEEYTGALERFEFNVAADFVWKKIQELDERITRDEPFKVVKEDIERGRAIIAECVAELYLIGCQLHPFLPSANEIIKAAVLANKKPENLFPRLT